MGSCLFGTSPQGHAVTPLRRREESTTHCQSIPDRGADFPSRYLFDDLQCGGRLTDMSFKVTSHFPGLSSMLVIPIPIAPTQGCSKCCGTINSLALYGIVNQLNKWLAGGRHGGCGFAEGFRATGSLRSLPCLPRVACRLVALVCFFLGTLFVSRWRRSSEREPAAL